MFDIGWSELVVIGIVALIVIGPKELPGVLRMLGQWMGKVRRMAADFQGQWNEAIREAEMADLKKQVDEISESARDFTGFDPVATARKEFESAVEDKPKTDSATPTTPEALPPPAEASAAESAPATPAEPPPAPVTQSEREFLGFADELGKPNAPAHGGERPA
jgi:sec-independent protein translocase protein TatB